MSEQAAILITRERNNNKEMLFVRLRGENFLQFPTTEKNNNETIKTTIRRRIKELLDLEASSITKKSVVLFQLPGASVTIIRIYLAEVVGDPRTTAHVEKIQWLNKAEVNKCIAQMSSVMQDYILPDLNENDLWA